MGEKEPLAQSPARLGGSFLSRFCCFKRASHQSSVLFSLQLHLSSTSDLDDVVSYFAGCVCFPILAGVGPTTDVHSEMSTVTIVKDRVGINAGPIERKNNSRCQPLVPWETSDQPTVVLLYSFVVVNLKKVIYFTPCGRFICIRTTLSMNAIMTTWTMYIAGSQGDI